MIRFLQPRLAAGNAQTNSQEEQMKHHTRFLAALAATALACGGSNTATSHNNPGTGTSTLLVTGDITATNDGAPATSFKVTVRDGMNNRVSGATVTISNSGLPNGSVTLVEVVTNSGTYQNAISQFPGGDFGLSVTRNTDNVQGVVVGGLGMHTINSPARNAVVPANQPLAVSWTTPSTAKQAMIQTSNFNGISMADTGSYTIAATNNPPNNSQQLQVARFNEVDIAGGLAGSRLRVTFNASVSPYVVQ
jgi:hypothetical protein